MQDVVRLKGFIELQLRSIFNNEIVDRRKINVDDFQFAGDNTIVTSGRRWVLQQIASSEIQTAQSISYMAVGTGTTAPATSDTGLGSETSRKAIGTFTTTNLTSNPPSWMAQTSWATNEANTTLGEVGLFNSSSAGTMLGRATYTTLNKTTSNTLTVSYTVSN
jgi:hypothetical protein